jgi:hypothetical protein
LAANFNIEGLKSNFYSRAQVIVYLIDSFNLGIPRTGAEEPHLSVVLDGACKVVLQSHFAL